MNVNPEQYGSLLIPMITSKLPSNVKLRVAREMKDEVWKMDDLVKVIKGEVEAREACERTKLKPCVKPHTSSITSPLQLVHFSHRVSAHNVFTVKGNITQPHVIKCRMSRPGMIYCLKHVDVSTV